MSTKIISAEIITLEGGIILYWEGLQQVIEMEIYKYLNLRGYKVIASNCPKEILTKSMMELPEEKLEKLGIPHFVDIVLPTPKELLTLDEDKKLCFPRYHREKGERVFNFTPYDVGFYNFSALLLQRKGFYIV